MGKLASCCVLLAAAFAVSGFELGPTDVVFHLFTRNNPEISEALWPTLDSIMRSTQFSLNRRTVITVHSDGDFVGGNFNAFLIPSYLQVEDVNLFAFDWSAGSSMYSIGLGNAPQAGKIIADFVNILVHNFEYSAENFVIVGVGLGAHVAGIAARNIDGEVPHIFALDPSLVGWTYNDEKLNKDDAEIVEVIHTSAGSLGYDYPLGDLDFYANGGSAQPGCADVECSQIYSYVYFAESLTAEVNGGNKFVGTACDSYEDVVNYSCDGPQDTVFGGTEDKSFASGIYFFLTNAQPPFARG